MFVPVTKASNLTSNIFSVERYLSICRATSLGAWSKDDQRRKSPALYWGELLHKNSMRVVWHALRTSYYTAGLKAYITVYCKTPAVVSLLPFLSIEYKRMRLKGGGCFCEETELWVFETGAKFQNVEQEPAWLPVGREHESHPEWPKDGRISFRNVR